MCRALFWKEYPAIYAEFLSHRSRMHPETRQSQAKLTAAQYPSSTVDGMPQCAKCGRKFKRVEGLKNHLQKECRHHEPASVPTPAVESVEAVVETATGLVADVPTTV